MKQCLSCHRSYSNDSLNFCSYDGASLSDAEATSVLTRQIDRSLNAAKGQTPGVVLSTRQPNLKTIVHRAICPHCGNITPQTLLYFHRVEDDELPQAYGHLLFECGTCNMALLYCMYDPPQTIDCTVISAKNNELQHFKLEWPNRATWILHHSVPASIKDCYVAALRNYREHNVFAGQIRKALEAICDERNILAGNLQYRLSELASQYGLPPIMIEILNDLRALGNTGTHVGAHGVPQRFNLWIDDLFRSVIHYLYITPSTLSALRYQWSSYKETGDGEP